EGENLLHQGTVVASGQGVGVVTAVGQQTAFGKLGKSIESIESEPTPLQHQINRFVRLMMLVGLVAFLLVFVVNYYYVGSIVAALLFSLSFGLALIPEEIPVAFTTFMALGAFRMTRKNVLVKQPKTVESLGSATVICLDKTGTITENQMTVAEVVDFAGEGKVLEYAMWASEPEPFDAMEKAIHGAYAEQALVDRRPLFKLYHEYPLGGQPPMMTHIHQNKDGLRVVATKGAVERILRVCKLPEAARSVIMERVNALSSSGYRVLGVARAEWPGEQFPADQDDFPWLFQGLVALFDPPKRNIHEVFRQFYQAGIQVKMITGDHAGTALNIARESGLRTGHTAPITGEAVMNLPEEDLRKKVGETVVFARMFPEAKLKVVQALKANGEVVAMTGDGVNDGPALKAAQIGVAMGRRGTEVAKGAASMVLMNDDLGGMAIAIENGRRIYANLRKAIRYIISIHIPIVLTVVLPLVFGWKYLHMLTPIHVIFLELIMDPTCAIAFENEPTEPGMMKKSPRKANSPLFSNKELWFSVLQGLILTLGILGMYQYALLAGADEATTRTFVFTTMLAGNLFLTFANRSFEHTIVRTFLYKNANIPIIAAVTLALMAAVLFIPWVNGLFKLAPVSMADAGLCVLTALVSVGWFEVWKALKALSRRGSASLSKTD
ncbi:MAG TPA: cation-translocating P-type ATPase, partial [Saprospiraceae bacterium]|nr:cation-translocating P-type ATPase [Saprospiraceae bacterium]